MPNKKFPNFMSSGFLMSSFTCKLMYNRLNNKNCNRFVFKIVLNMYKFRAFSCIITFWNHRLSASEGFQRSPEYYEWLLIFHIFQPDDMLSSIVPILPSLFHQRLTRNRKGWPSGRILQILSDRLIVTIYSLLNFLY